MTKTTKPLSAIWTALCAAATSVSLGLDFAVQRKAQPDALDTFGFLYQAIARTFSAFRADPLSTAILFVALWWLYRRYLYHKPQNAGVGEYLLCGAMSLAMLLYASLKACGSVGALWSNGFQLIKAALYGWGMTSLFLGLLRALNEALAWDKRPARRWKRMEARPFAGPFVLLALCWLPQLVIKYPGVLMWDTYHQIKQFVGEYPRMLNHPPFGTLVYGLIYTLGKSLGNVNAGYFLFTLLQTGCLIAVLAYSLSAMKRLGVRTWVRYGALALYAASPCYAGWATVIGKDAAYLILCMLLCTLLLEAVSLRAAFWDAWGRPALLTVTLSLMMLTRHNGVLIAVPVLAALLFPLLGGKAGSARRRRWLCCAALCAALTLGVESAIVSALRIGDAYLHDTLSLPFQQTARVVKLHDADIPREEKETIDRVLAYDAIGSAYEETYADAVKDTYRKEATAEDRRAYLGVWLRQLTRYPVDYLDALMHMNGVMFDLQTNYPMYISLSDAALTDYVYPMSYNDMKLYEREELAGLNSAQRALTEWYYRFDDLPLIGLFASMGFCNLSMLMLGYLMWIHGRKRALLVVLPAFVTAVGCLLSPVVYLRYALPLVCTLPLWVAGYDVEARRGNATLPCEDR